MAATCSVPKDKLYCKHCDIRNSHNTSTCFKKQREDKEKIKGPKEVKSGKEKPQISPDMSEERQPRNLSRSFRIGQSSPIVKHCSCVQLGLNEDNDDSND